ncbi:HEPN domain-containing protein [Candidatus Pacearchaeota archaeon]|nr:HEPN domain-containing protein [Candidatus Pacearchaeota archaeon]
MVLARELNAPKNIIDYARLLTPAYLYTRYPDVINTEELTEKIEELTKHSEEIIT